MNNEKFASDEKVPLSTQFPDLPHVEWGYNPGSGMMRVRNGKTQTEITRWIGTHRSSIGTYVTMLMEELGVQPPEFRPVDMPENAPAVVETDSDSQKA